MVNDPPSRVRIELEPVCRYVKVESSTVSCARNLAVNSQPSECPYSTLTNRMPTKIYLALLAHEFSDGYFAEQGLYLGSGNI